MFYLVVDLKTNIVVSVHPLQSEADTVSILAPGICIVVCMPEPIAVNLLRLVEKII